MGLAGGEEMKSYTISNKQKIERRKVRKREEGRERTKERKKNQEGD